MSSAVDARREHQQRLAAAERKDAPLIRALIREGLSFLGIELNAARNVENAVVIDRRGLSRFTALEDYERKLPALAKSFEGLLCVRRIPSQ